MNDEHGRSTRPDGSSPGDDAVIGRLRNALDELTAHAPAHGLVPVEPHSTGFGPARWLAVAAAAVLVVGATAAVVINRNNATSTASTPTEVATTQPLIEPELIRSVVPWYVLSSPDLVPGDEVLEPCCPAQPATGSNVVMAWARTTGTTDGLLTMTELLHTSGSTVGAVGQGVSTREVDGATLVFASYGISSDERESLAAQVVTGSGLPYVLPADGWEFVATGRSTDGEHRSQTYTPATTDPLSSYMPTVTITVGDYRGELEWLTRLPEPQQVAIAGNDGWKVTNDEGGVDVVWRTSDGSWATLRMDAVFADRADGLIAAVAEITEGEPSPVVETVPAPDVSMAAVDEAYPVGIAVDGTPLPEYDASGSGADPAIGLAAPAVMGFDYSGRRVTIDPADGPHLVLVEAHWCPHCTATLPRVVQWMADGTIPEWLTVTLVSTAESPDGANYPAVQWLQDLGWTGPVIRDSSNGDGAAGPAAEAYGVTGLPSFVLIGADGTVVARLAGEPSAQDMASLIAALPAP